MTIGELQEAMETAPEAQLSDYGMYPNEHMRLLEAIGQFSLGKLDSHADIV